MEVTRIDGAPGRGNGVGALTSRVEVDGDEVVAGSRCDRERRAGAEARSAAVGNQRGSGDGRLVVERGERHDAPDVVERLLAGAVGRPDDHDAAAALGPVRDDHVLTVGREVEGDRLGDAGRTRSGQPHCDLLPRDDRAVREIDEHERARVADPVRNLQRQVATVR